MTNTQNYDKASISLCEDFADNFFRNFDTQTEQIKPSELFSSISFDMLEKRNALDNYILKYYSRLDDKSPVDAKIKRNMNQYLQVVYKRFAVKPIELIGSPFLNDPKTVDTYCPSQVQIKGKNVDLRSRVKEVYRATIKDKKALYIRDRDSNNLSKEEIDILMHSLITSIGTDDKEVQKYQEEYLKKLISKKSKVNELSTKQVEFVAKYINNLMLTSRLKELGYSRDELRGYIYVGEDIETLGGFEYENTIYINKNSVLTRDIPSLIQTVCHETEHSIQELEASKNPKSKIGLDFAIRKVLQNYYFSEKGYDVYNKNYRFEQIEQDAEQIGYDRAIRYLDVFGFKDEAKKLHDIKVKDSDSRRFEYDYREDENGGKYSREEFFFNSLNKALAKKPYMVKQYPALSLLYEQDGKVKSFEDIITGDFKLNDKSKCDILEDFCKYYIANGELDTFDLKKFPEEVQANIASRLITILVGEKGKIGMMGKEIQQYKYKDVNDVDKILVENFHLITSRNIMRFMNKNYQHFMRLQDNGKFSSIMNMDYYYNNVKFLKYDNNYEHLAYNNSNYIEEIKELSIEAEENKNQYRANKKKQCTFNASTIETSFDSLLENSRLSGFHQATQVIKSLANEDILQIQEELEEK